jgi:hypothetical protein
MGVIYRRLGNVDLWGQPDEKTRYSPESTLSPQSKNKFREFTEESGSLLHEMATPESLGITFPYPEYFIDNNGLHWKRYDLGDNQPVNDIFSKRDRIANNTTDKGNTWIPRTPDKDAKVSRPGTTPEGYIMSSTISAYKKRGSL